MDYLKTRKFQMPRPEDWNDKNDTYALTTYNNEKEVPESYVLCLTKASESFHHWKIFAPESAKDEGVCIEFRRAALLEAATTAVQSEANGTKLVHREMEYIQIEKLKSGSYSEDDLPFLKRLPYRNEEEYRLCVTTLIPPKSDRFCFDLPLDTVRRITLSPWTSKRVFQQQRDLIKAIPGCEHLEICHSSLLENERWKKLISELT
jgi:hypothetical protein